MPRTRSFNVRNIALLFCGCLLEGVDDRADVSVSHLRIERQDDAVVLGKLGMRQGRPQRRLAVDGLTVRAHDSATGRNPRVEHFLHDIALVAMVGDLH